MPLILAPSFDDHTRKQVEEHLEIVRDRRIAVALEYVQGQQLKLETEEGSISSKLARKYDMLHRALVRLDKDLAACETYVADCEMLRDELGLVHDRIELAKR